MWRYSAKETNSGFTLVEVAVVVIIVGILATISAPSILSIYARSRVNQALAEVQSALQEGQRQAMRTSQSCLVAVDNIPPAVTGTCLATGDRPLRQVALRTSTRNLRFGIDGTVAQPNTSPLTSNVTLVISSPYTGLQRCLVMSAPLGLIRTGIYTGSDTIETNCLPR